MKNFLAKLKSANYKQLAIDHGEKIVAGTIGLFLLFALLGTRWSGYDKTPAELKEQVDKASRAISQQTWEKSADGLSGKYSAAAGVKDADVHQLLARDEQIRSRMIEDGLTKYANDQKWMWSPVDRREPARRVDVVPALELLAVSHKAIIPLATVSANPEEEAGDQPAGPQRPRVKLRGDFGNGDAAGGPMPGAQGFPGLPGAAALPGLPGGSPMGEPGMGAGAHEASGLRFNAIRAIVPLRRQIESIAAALSISEQKASLLVAYWDFNLERRAKPTDEKQDWTAWEKVDIRTAQDIMDKAAGWDSELIDLALTNEVLTMPLLSRVLYFWDKSIASHPRLDNYVLSPSQRELQMDLYKEAVDQHIEQIADLQSQRPGGFAQNQMGNRQYTSQIGNARSQNAQDIATRLARSRDRENMEKIRDELLEQMIKSDTAAGRLLLFRYFDFDVRPGTTYQYRVQLVMKNPNFGRSQQDVIDPEITKEEFLTSPFSQPTADVAVPKEVNFYVTKVDEARGSNPPSATFNVFQWSEKYGSTINEELKVLFGSFVGERTKTDVVDVPNMEYREGEEVDFKSDDVLVDIVDSPGSIDIEVHQDLAGLPSDVLRRGLGVSEQALLVTESGKLVAYDPLSMSGKLQKSKAQLAQEDELFGDQIKAKGAAGADAGAGLEMYEQPAGDPAAMPQQGRRRGATSLRRRRGARGRAPMPMPGGIGGGV